MTDRRLVCVYASDEVDRSELELVRVALEARGIEVVREGRDRLVPHLPAGGWPGRLLVPADREDEARREVEAWFAARASPRPERPSWTCPDCGEENGAPFEHCWKCGEVRS